MECIRNWQDLDKYGFRLLTGESDAYGMRLLFDLTEQGWCILKEFFGFVNIEAGYVLAVDWNGGPAVGSVLLPRDMFSSLAAFILLHKRGCRWVAISPDGQVDGATEEDYKTFGAEKMDEQRAMYEDQGFSFVAPLPVPQKKGRVIHRMSGRTA